MPVKRPYVPEVEVDHRLHDDGEGLRVTREQIRDVYFAGTSDGIVFLDEGRVRNLQATAGIPDDVE
ncbi:hypothetical protein URH17368_2440 [Alicyclobacillus hesperidum URH17-3-68]|nr:hypothetical protein URH17368_2440 [Alicyclobacillus hesperidum URH17-3-68]